MPIYRPTSPDAMQDPGQDPVQDPMQDPVQNIPCKRSRARFLGQSTPPPPPCLPLPRRRPSPPPSVAAVRCRHRCLPSRRRLPSPPPSPPVATAVRRRHRRQVGGEGGGRRGDQSVEFSHSDVVIAFLFFENERSNVSGRGPNDPIVILSTRPTAPKLHTPLLHRVGHIVRRTLPTMPMIIRTSQTWAQYVTDSC